MINARCAGVYHEIRRPISIQGPKLPGGRPPGLLLGLEVVVESLVAGLRSDLGLE